MRLTSQQMSDHLPPQFGDDAERYQTGSRNLGFTKRYSKAHETHYEPWVQTLVADAPLHLPEHHRVPLPPPDPQLLTMGIGEAVARRRSGRIYGDEALPQVQLSTLLYHAIGVRPPELSPQPLALSRNVTSAGNLGSVEAYPIVMRVEGITPGIYHYDSVAHDLALVAPGVFDTWLREVVFFQLEFADAAVALILTSAVGRLKAKYGPRGYRFALLDIGHVSQNIYLIATGLHLPVCATAGFVDEAVNAALHLDGLEACATLTLLLGAPSMETTPTQR